MEVQKRAKELQGCSFVQRKAIWTSQGKTVCRHGVFWRRHRRSGCPCMANTIDEAQWFDAVLMPALDHASRSILVAPFDAQYFRRLAVLQAEMRRLRW